MKVQIYNAVPSYRAKTMLIFLGSDYNLNPLYRKISRDSENKIIIK